jgi:hypothetical protein
VYQISTTNDTSAPNTKYGVVVLEQTPFHSVTSFLQVQVNSFGVSSIQFACYQVNDDVVTFQNIPSSIGGFTVSEDQYDCSKFKTQPIKTPKGHENATRSTFTDAYQVFDIEDDLGLALEVLLALVYISIAAFYAYRAYKLHIAQRTRSDFKTNINIAFFAMFTIWASGNLIHLIAYFFKTRESNYYVKQVLTLTYFATYLIFVMAIHYRY